jgi:hypothetical protein
MRARLIRLFSNAARALQPRGDFRSEAIALSTALGEAQARESRIRADYSERVAELIEARQMAGAGPWLMEGARINVDKPGTSLRESMAMSAQGAMGDLELALQNVDWVRQVNLSWMEFSRWGIQQIILISRLYYLKNPICRRLVDVCAAYVFARGVEVTTNDDAANDTLDEFFERNKCVLGQNSLVAHERSKDTDGNLFFVFFADSQNSGKTTVRTIDATEIADIICDPDDADTPWYYRRHWDQRNFDVISGTTGVQSMDAWYPALNFTPKTDKPPTINQIPVQWDHPVLHRKAGAVAKWHFGCPRLYPMLAWLRESVKFLEACAGVRQTLSQFAMMITTKGGQQAQEGIKQQMSTTVGPSTSLWDQNPPAVKGSTFVSGPGTTLEAFKVSGAGFSPEDVRQYKLMCCMVKGVPETFLGDVSTGNLATAASLDRPTETMFLELQEAWREDLTTIAKYVLGVSAGAPSGTLREAHKQNVRIVECARKTLQNGRRIYEKLDKSDDADIEIQVNFPAIREGDIPALVTATALAMTLGNRGGQIVGIDEKEGVKLLYDQLGVENGEALAEEQYPDGKYDPERDQQELTAPIGKAQPSPGGQPQIDPKTGETLKPNLQKIEAASNRLSRALRALERNGHTDPVGHGRA